MADTLNFYLVTDTHHYSVAAHGVSDHTDQKCMNEAGPIIDAVFEKFIAQDEVNIILIAGDLTNNGERASHAEFTEKLRRLQAAGKRVFVITATHDFGLREPDDGSNIDPNSPYTYRSELRGLYNEFGFQEAIAEYGDLSYVAQLIPGFRLLALNDDGNGRSFCGYDETHLQWILEQIQAAKESGDYIFAMTHHPVLPPTPAYPMFSKRDMLGDYENTSTILADAGLEFIFTGHTHMLNIGKKTTERGNTLWDINTGSLVGYPTPIRFVTLDNDRMIIKTERIDTFEWDFEGKEPQQYLRDHFDKLLNDIFDSMAFDFERFVALAGGFSMERKTAEKLKIPIKLIGKLMQKLTLGKAGRLLFVRKKIDKSVRDILIKDLVVEIVRNVFAGTEKYSPDTPLYIAVMALLGRLNPLIKRAVGNIGAYDDVRKLVADLLYDDTPDIEAELPHTRNLSRSSVPAS